MRRNTRNFKKRSPSYHPHPQQPQQQAQQYQEPDLSPYMDKTLKELHEMAKELEILGYNKLRKQDLALRIVQADEIRQNTRYGILEIMPEGYGFLRVNGYFPSADDVYISQTQIKRFRLQTGHMLVGQVRPAKDGEKYYSLIKIDSVNGLSPDQIGSLPHFEKLVPVYPEGHYKLERTIRPDLSMRILDIFCPIGRGQRGLIVSPPKAGKTTLLKSIAASIAENYPEIMLIALLIDERPEEVTDFERSIKGEVVASTFDRLPEHHTRITELVLEKAKRQVEAGRDVVILCDSITRMSRAYNLIIPPSGRTLSGGLDPNAMHSPKRFFGAARKVEFGGSLTILAT
ncbi:MAG TPA: transcription termination factor Rho, partial [Candidatus Obscuribacterales bacterium]